MMGTVLVVVRLLRDVDARLRRHISRRGELVTLIILILNTIDLMTVPVLEMSSDIAETTVKLPATLRDKVKSIACKRGSSMNALINSAILAYTQKKD
jgi:hypothetical protein